MSDPLYYADGVLLDDVTHWVGASSQPWQVPGTKGGNVPIPARHGALWVAGKTFGEAELTLELVVSGADRTQMQNNINKLLRIFTKRNKLIYLEKVMPDGSRLECYAEGGSAFDLTKPSDLLPFAKMAIPLRIPAAFWQDSTEVTWSSPTGIETAQAFQMPEFVGGTAPMDDGLYLVHGPADNPEIQVVDSGAYVRYEGNLAADETWRLNAAKWESVKGVDIGFTQPGTSIIGATVHGGSAAFVDLPPLASGDLGLQFAGQNLGTSTQLEARGRRKYLIAA